MTEYVQAGSTEQINEAGKLFREYADSLGCSPCLQNIEKELGRLPGEYAPPEGRLLLALSDGKAVGCVALRNIGSGVCEMRRLYLRPELRGRKIGRGLAVALIGEARKAGYSRMRLYTLPSMKEAIELYHSLGFKNIEPYGEHRIDEAIYMDLEL